MTLIQNRCRTSLSGVNDKLTYYRIIDSTESHVHKIFFKARLKLIIIDESSNCSIQFQIDSEWKNKLIRAIAAVRFDIE